LNEDLALIARKCIAEYGPEFSNKITVLSCHSKELKIGTNQGDMLKKVSIIATELVDSGLLGEHIIETLRDASLRLLCEGGIVIPHSATVYGYPIESALIASRQRVLTVQKDRYIDNHRNTLSDINMKSVCVEIAENNNISSKCFEVDESYTCESLSQSFPYKALTEPYYMQKIIFSECYALDGMSGSEEETFPPSPIVELKLIMKETGTIDGFALWFDLHLEVSADNTALTVSTTISTAPGRDSCGWDQAIIFGNKIANSVSTDGTYPLIVTKGQGVTFECSHTDDQINLKLVMKEASPDRLLLLPSIQTCSENNTRENEKILLGEMDIAMLNDVDRSAAYLYGLQAALSKGNTSREHRSLSVLELSSNWQSTIINALNMTSVDCRNDNLDDKAMRKVLQMFEMMDEVRVTCPSKESGVVFSDVLNNYSNKKVRVSVSTGSIVDSYLSVQNSNLKLDDMISESDGRNYDAMSTNEDIHDDNMDVHVNIEGGQLITELSTEFSGEYEEQVPPEPMLSCWGPYSIIVCDLIEGSGLIRQGCLQVTIVMNICVYMNVYAFIYIYTSIFVYSYTYYVLH
jgi:hypothetical protein